MVWQGRRGFDVRQIRKCNRGAKKTNITAMNTSGQFSVTIKGVPKDKFVRGVIFAKVQDDAGHVTWVQSEESKAANK